MDIGRRGRHSMSSNGAVIKIDRSDATHPPNKARPGRIGSRMFAIPRIKDIVVLSFVGLIAAAGLACAPVLAQETYPSRSMKIVTPLAAGSASDIALRFLA